MADLSPEKLLLLCNLSYSEKGHFNINAFTEKDANLQRKLGTIIDEMIGAESIERDDEWEDKWEEKLNEYIELNKSAELNVGDATAEEWANILRAIRKDEQLSEMKVKKVDRDNRGALNIYLKDSAGKGYAVFRGTGGGEWYDNFEGGMKSDTEQQRRALEFINSIDDDDITVIGHSKGGNKAKYVTVLSEKITRCISYDGEGFSPEFLQKYSDLIEKRKEIISNYALDNDFVNILLFDIGRTHYIMGQNIGTDFGSNHSPHSFYKFGQKGSYGFEYGMQSQEMETLHEFICYMINTAPEKERDILLDYLGTIIHHALGSDQYVDKNFDIVGYILSEDNAEALGLLLGYVAAYDAFDHSMINTVLDIMKKMGPKMVVLSNLLSHLDRKYGLKNFLGNAALFSAGCEWLFNKVGLNGDSKYLQKVLAVSSRTFLNLPVNKAAFSREFSQSTRKRDFTEQMKEQLLALCASVESEPFYDITKWDIWYRGEKWFGRLTYDNYKKDIMQYYQKTIDINGTTKTEIEKIFSEVHAVNDQYASEFRNRADALHALSMKLPQMKVKTEI